MQGHSIEARGADGALVGHVIVPPQSQRVHNAKISWTCGQCDAFADFPLGSRDQAVNRLSGHLETEHPDNPVRYFVIATGTGTPLSSEDGMDLTELRDFLTET